MESVIDMSVYCDINYYKKFNKSHNQCNDIPNDILLRYYRHNLKAGLKYDKVLVNYIRDFDFIFKDYFNLSPTEIENCVRRYNIPPEGINAINKHVVFSGNDYQKALKDNKFKAYHCYVFNVRSFKFYKILYGNI